MKRISSATVMSKYGCGIKVHSGEISYEILSSKHTLARYKVSQNSPKSASKGSVVLYVRKWGQKDVIAVPQKVNTQTDRQTHIWTF